MTAMAAPTRVPVSMPPLYLSRLPLNPRNRAVRADLADCHGLHRTILRAFPRVPDNGIAGEATQLPSARDHFDVLYRVEGDRRASDALVLLVQSGVAPDWSGLLHEYPGYLLASSGAPATFACKRVDHLYAALEAGAVLSFRLRANPTRKIDTYGGPDSGERRNGRRVELQGKEKQLEWLRRKGTQGGFELLTTAVNPDVLDVRAASTGKVTGTRGTRETSADADAAAASRSLTFGSVLFEGRLRVVDTDALRNALVQGIGSGKAYGFGLLSLAPAGPRDAVATAGTVGR